jgi:PH (Pleckstrin Homology) domain-containing protein
MPLDRGSIEQQLHALGESSRWWERRELRDLPSALHPDERILAIALGKPYRSGPRGRRWLIVVTSTRLLCMQPGRRGTHRQLDVQASQITGLAMRTRVFGARVIVTTLGEKYRLRVQRADAFKLLTALSNIVPPRDTIDGRTPTVMIGRVIKHMLALPTVALNPEVKPVANAPAFDPAPLEQRLQILEDEVQRLQQQVDFLEELLQQRSLVGVAVPGHEYVK